MHIQEPLFLINLTIFCLSSSLVISPSGNHYVKSNIQLMCTDDVVNAIQPQWISPLGKTIEEYKPHQAYCASSQYCDDDNQKYCYNAFATCINNRCVCQKFGIDPCTCLVSLGDCRMVRDNSQNIAVATLRSDNLPSYITCKSNTAAEATEVHIIAMKYGIGSPDFTNVNVKILNRIIADKDVVLVLVSDRLVFWKVNIESDERLHRLVQLSRFQDEDNLKVSSGYVDGIDKPKNAPFGIGDDEQFGGKTVDMLLYLQEKYGHVSSFTGTYTANEWNITIDLSKSNQANAEHTTSIFTERVMPWKTKLTITAPKDENFGNYICRGRTFRSGVTLFKKDPISIDAPSLQNLTFGESGIVKCVVSGRPKPVVTWSFNQTTLNESEKYTMETDGSLSINKAVENDGGEYKCRGSQQETDESRTKSIQVLIIHSAYQKINITSLTPSTEYDVHAFAVSKGGKSNISNFINFTTNEEENVRKAASHDINTTLKPSTDYVTHAYTGSNGAKSNISEFMNLTSKEDTTTKSSAYQDVNILTPSTDYGVRTFAVSKGGKNISNFINFTSNKEENYRKEAGQTVNVIYCGKKNCNVSNGGKKFEDFYLLCIGISRCYIANSTDNVCRHPPRFHNAINSSNKLAWQNRCRWWWGNRILPFVLSSHDIYEFILETSFDILLFRELNQTQPVKHELKMSNYDIVYD